MKTTTPTWLSWTLGTIALLSLILGGLLIWLRVQPSASTERETETKTKTKTKTKKEKEEESALKESVENYTEAVEAYYAALAEGEDVFSAGSAAATAYWESL